LDIGQNFVAKFSYTSCTSSGDTVQSLISASCIFFIIIDWHGQNWHCPDNFYCRTHNKFYRNPFDRWNMRTDRQSWSTYYTRHKIDL